MRIGIRLAPDHVRGASYVDDVEAATSEHVAPSHEAVSSVLRGLAKQSNWRRGQPVTVAFDLDALLTEYVARPAEELVEEKVLLLWIAPRSPSHPALLQHPDPLVARHVRAAVSVRGGHAVTGEELALLDEAAVRDVADRVSAGVFGDIRDVAVVASGARASSDHERRAAEVFLATVDGVRVSTSCDFGGVGLTERACSAVINAVLARHAEPLVTECELAAREVFGDVPIGFATGDGGRLLAPRMRSFPVVGLRATVACSLAGAARAFGMSSTRVLLLDQGRLRQGEVTAGLPVTLPEFPLISGIRLSVPTPKLAEVSPASLEALLSEGEDRLLVIGEGADLGALGLSLDDDRVVRIGSGDASLRGCAHSEPVAYIDEIAAVVDAEDVRRARADVEGRALVMAVSAGGEPGTERIVESSVMGVPYGGQATVRLRVRAACGLSGS